MGFRFRKSFKVAPGVRVNLGKKSASVSFGGKGIRHTVSTTGRQTSTVGIPGTGIYYTESYSGKKRNSNNNTYNNYSNTNYSDNLSEVESFNNSIGYITSFHKECDYDYNWNEIVNRPSPLNNEGKGINEIETQQTLENYVPGFFENSFKFLKNRKIKTLENNIIAGKEKDKQSYDDWKKLSNQGKSILDGDLDAYTDLIQDVEFSSNLIGFVPNFQLKTKSSDMMTIDFDINIEDVIPESYKTLTSTGRLSIKKYNKTSYYSLIQQYVCSFAFRIARNIFGLLPIKTTLINIQTNTLDTQTGNMVKNTILSVKMDRTIFQSLNMESIVPVDALNNFDHNIKFLKTKGFQPIEKIM